MAAGAKQCPNCGSLQPANDSECVCPRCGIRQATSEPQQRRTPATRPNPEANPRQPGAHTQGRDPGAAPPQAEAAGNRTTAPGDPSRTPDDRGAARGATVRYFGDYEIQRELGRGGMGVVYKARQVKLNRPVALKMIKSGMLADPEDLRRFQNEAEAVALLDHPGIVPIYEVGEHDGQRYFSMKLIEGGNLADQLASFRENPQSAVPLMIAAAEAVQHAHMRGILHRDLKPANILVDKKGHPHITDFGLAKRIESDVELTASGAIMGTPAYMSPEQTAGERGTITTATDVYGLGAILYATLTGKAPFGGESVIQTLAAVMTHLPEPPKKRNAEVPRDLELICLKCLEKNPVDRYPTAQALVDELRRFAAGEPVSVRAAGSVERLAKWARRKPALAAVYALGLLTLLFGGLGGAAVWQWRAAARARDVAATAKASAEQARDGEATARAAAEQARDGEATARATAEKARDEVTRTREELARVEYGRTMEVAHQQWRDNNVPATLALLERTQPDLRGWEWRYVRRLCHSDLLTLKGHKGRLLSASFSPDGSTVLTIGTDKTARVWDAKTGVELITLRADTWVDQASFSPDGTRVLAAVGDRAKLWDAKTGVEALTLKGHTGRLVTTSFSPDGARVVTAGGDKTAKVWNAMTGAKVCTLAGQSEFIESASFSPDGSRIVTASNDKTAKVWLAKLWDARTGVEVHTLTGHTDRVASASFSPDGSRVVTRSDDLTAKVWNAKTGVEVHTLKGHNRPIWSSSFSPDGARILTAGWDTKVRVWDTRTGVEILTLKGHAGPVMSASFSLDGSRMISSSRDMTARVWDAKTGVEVLTLKGHTDVVPSASCSRDGSRIVTASNDETAKVWDATAEVEFRSLKGHTKDVFSAIFSPDGSRVLTASLDNTAKVWDARSCTEVLTLKGGNIQFLSASFSPDGSRIVTTGGKEEDLQFHPDNAARVWDARTGAEVLTVKGHADVVHSASFNPDGSRIVTGSRDKTARVWDAKTGTEILTLKGQSKSVVSSSFSPDGSRIVSTSTDEIRSATTINDIPDTITRVWDAKTGAEVLTLKGRTGVSLASFSPEGMRIVTINQDKTATVWDAKSGQETLTLTGHTNLIRSAAFSPDGSRIVTASMDNTARVWDAKTGVEVLTLKGDTSADSSMLLGPLIWSASFSPDGMCIVTANANGTAKIWDATPIRR